MDLTGMWNGEIAGFLSLRLMGIPRSSCLQKAALLPSMSGSMHSTLLSEEHHLVQGWSNPSPTWIVFTEEAKQELGVKCWSPLPTPILEVSWGSAVLPEKSKWLIQTLQGAEKQGHSQSFSTYLPDSSEKVVLLSPLRAREACWLWVKALEIL